MNFKPSPLFILAYRFFQFRDLYALYGISVALMIIKHVTLYPFILFPSTLIYTNIIFSICQLPGSRRKFFCIDQVIEMPQPVTLIAMDLTLLKLLLPVLVSNMILVGLVEKVLLVPLLLSLSHVSLLFLVLNSVTAGLVRSGIVAGILYLVAVSFAAFIPRTAFLTSLVINIIFFDKSREFIPAPFGIREVNHAG